MRLRDVARDGVDALLELSVVGSFSKVGFVIRRELYRWPTGYGRLDGRVEVVTGATSGLGRETATTFARLGAHVVLVVRDSVRGAQVRDDIVSGTGNSKIDVVVADMGDLQSVRAAAAQLGRFEAIHVLVHNAGTLEHVRGESAQGIELTVAVQLLGPFLLTTLVMTELHAGRARVIWVTSGGMYSRPIDVDALEMTPAHYDGVGAYARVKRAQVSLVEWWAPGLVDKGVVMVTMHPGWADTPGVQRSLPTFRRLMGPLLRSTAEGADTIVWLATSHDSPPSGGVWLDRRSRPVHRLKKTRRSDTAQERERLWQYCTSRTAAQEHGAAGDA